MACRNLARKARPPRSCRGGARRAGGDGGITGVVGRRSARGSRLRGTSTGPRRRATSNSSTTILARRRSTLLPGNFGFVNSDLAFTGEFAIAGNFNGFQVYDLADPSDPTLRTSFVCPGGQGDVSVYGNLLFMSVEETRGRIDCGTQGAPGPVNPERFRGVRIFDISDIDNPMQLARVCRRAAGRTPTQWSPIPTTRTTSTSTTPAPLASARRTSWRAARTPLSPPTR